MSRLVLGLAVVIVVSGCEPRFPGPLEAEISPSEPVEDAQAPGDSAQSCRPRQHPPVEGGEHLLGEAGPPVPYSSVPPTSGWHASGAVEIRIYDDQEPLREPAQVSVLEAGGVVVAHHALSPDVRDRLEEHARDEYPGIVAVTPYDELGTGQIAFTAWGVLQICDGLDLDELARFVSDHAEADPGAHP